MDPSEYKNYILTFLFLKYLSDLCKDKYDEHMKKFHGDQARVRRRMDRERFILPENSWFDYLYGLNSAFFISPSKALFIHITKNISRLKLCGT